MLIKSKGLSAYVSNVILGINAGSRRIPATAQGYEKREWRTRKKMQ
jgi:hypothetical protein